MTNIFRRQNTSKPNFENPTTPVGPRILRVVSNGVSRIHDFHFALTCRTLLQQSFFMDAERFENLLEEHESETLDFKVDQYSFKGATDDEKSELLKDILAFANASRKREAYILIGVQEAKGRKSRVDGITKDHLVDSELQQFVNQKTNRPIEFHYRPIEIGGRPCATIHIPVQKERPYFLLKDFGKLKAHQVPIRRGSSTGFANPDEAIKMAPKSVTIPILLGLVLLVLCVIVYFQKQASRGFENPIAATAQTNTVARKPLPDINLPNPPDLATVMANTNIPLKRGFVITDPSVKESPEGALSNEIAAQKQKTAQDRMEAQSRAEEDWTNNLADRKYALISLHKILDTEAGKFGDRIKKSEDYFDCLPSTTNLDDNDAVVAEIGLSNKTSVHFIVSIIKIDQHIKRLRISGSCGSVEFFADNEDPKTPARLFRDFPAEAPLFEQKMDLPHGKSENRIDRTLNLLVAIQMQYCDPTNNKGVTNRADNK
jgi:hypothetical protein